MMSQYYRGHIRRHAAFWVDYRKLPFGERFPAFLDFYRQINHEVALGDCSLRDAGYALDPGYYDKAVQADPQSGDMTIACDLARELADWVFESKEEAAENWMEISDIFQKYL